METPRNPAQGSVSCLVVGVDQSRLIAAERKAFSRRTRDVLLKVRSTKHIFLITESYLDDYSNRNLDYCST